MDPTKDWEAKLRKLGMPAELPSEIERAEKVGINMIPLESTDLETIELAKMLASEDLSNIFGGFPTSMDNLLALCDTLREEWLAEGVRPIDIKTTIHSSCVNGKDCVVMSSNGKKYHYNTKRISRYSRDKLLSFLKLRRVNYREMN